MHYAIRFTAAIVSLYLFFLEAAAAKTAGVGTPLVFLTAAALLMAFVFLVAIFGRWQASKRGELSEALYVLDYVAMGVVALGFVVAALN